MKFTESERADWEARWRENRIGFHVDAVNPYLEQFQSALLADSPQRVLVPLCGKSHDMPWLAQRVPEVIGIELSEIAVQALFEEHGLPVAREGAVWRGGGLTVYQEDFFTVNLPAPADAAYDRAALIAMPPARRPQYAGHLLRLLRPGARILLIGLEYDAGVTGGPPYSVPDGEVQSLFSPHCDMERLWEGDTLEQSPHLKRRGVTWLKESVWQMQRRD
jgi:thiopurine S-methyltransferase